VSACATATHRRTSSLSPDEWRLIAVSFLVITVVFGCGRFAYSTLIVPMRVDFEASRQVMALMAMSNLVGYLTGSVVSASNGRHARRIVVPALVVAVASLLGLALAPSVPLALVLLVTVGFVSGLAFVAAAGLLSTAFDVNRGRAVGLAMAGVGGGILLTSGISSLLLSSGTASWRWVWVLAALYTLGVAAVARTVYPRLRSATAPVPAEEPPPAPTRGTWRRWFLFAAYVAWGFGQVVQITLLPEFLVEERGIAPATASLVYGASGLTMVLASPLVGLASDRVGRRLMYGACLACAVLSVGFVVLGSSIAWYLTGSLLFGVPVSGVGALTPAMVADLWRPEQFAAVFGGMTALFGTAQALGPSMAALSIDRTGSLHAAYVGSLAFCALALVSAIGLPATRSARSIPATPPVH